jgi:hypothetical protein
MTKTPIERIAEIIATQDVRDPRGALDAIDKLIADVRKKTKAAAPHEDEPVFTASVFDCPDSPGSLKCKVVVEFCDGHLEQRHITALNIMMVKFCNEIGV